MNFLELPESFVLSAIAQATIQWQNSPLLFQFLQHVLNYITQIKEKGKASTKEILPIRNLSPPVTLQK